MVSTIQKYNRAYENGFTRHTWQLRCNFLYINKPNGNTAAAHQHKI